MVEHEEDNKNVLPFGTPPDSGEELPYYIELRDASDHDTVERVLARAHNRALARAIFKAAQSEHPDRVITLRRGAEVIDSGWER